MKQHGLYTEYSIITQGRYCSTEDNKTEVWTPDLISTVCHKCAYGNQSCFAEPCYSCKSIALGNDEFSTPSKFVHKVEPQIKDSGERTKFESGAVRDMHDGKGRCDLLPMCVILRLARHYENGCKKYGDRNWEQGIPAHSFADSALRHMFKYMDGQTDEDHLIAAIWNLCGLAWTEEKKPEMMDIPARQTKEVQ